MRKLNAHASGDGNASLKRSPVRAELHVQVQASASTWASEVGLLKAELGLGVIHVVGLGRAVVSSTALGGTAGLVGAVDAHSKVVARAVASIPGLLGIIVGDNAVDQGDVEPDLVVLDGVLVLRMLAVDQLVGLADFHRHAATVAGRAIGLGVPAASRNVEWSEGGALDNTPYPDIIGAAVAHDGVAGERNAGVESRKSENRLEQHFSEGVKNRLVGS